MFFYGTILYLFTAEGKVKQGERDSMFQVKVKGYMLKNLIELVMHQKNISVFIAYLKQCYSGFYNV